MDDAAGAIAPMPGRQTAASTASSGRGIRSGSIASVSRRAWRSLRCAPQQEEAPQLRRLVLSPPRGLATWMVRNARRVCTSRPAPPPPARFRRRGSACRPPGPATQTEKRERAPTRLAEQRSPEARRRQAAPDDVLLGLVAQPGEPRAGSLGAEQPRVARGRPSSTPTGQHHECLDHQVPALPRGEGLDRDLVADPFDEHDRPGGRGLAAAPRGWPRSPPSTRSRTRREAARCRSPRMTPLLNTPPRPDRYPVSPEG